MKIAMITTWFPPTIVGSGNRFYEVGKRLSSIYEIHVFTTGVRGYAEEEKMEGMHIHRCGMSEISKNESNEKKYHMFKLKFCLDVLKRLDKSFDIIDCNVVSKPLSYVSFFASGHTPLILTWHEVWYEQNFRILNPALALPGFFLELFMPKLSDFNITVSQTS
jgi:glycosyltransferase involved in cell wall biosynthesis